MRCKIIHRLFSTIFFGMIFVITSCRSTAQLGDANTRNRTEQKRSENESQSTAGKSAGPLYFGNGGKGIVIAVPAPVMENGSATDKWIPQLFQDLITGDFARYSAMTVLDRANEQLVLAEQQLSMSGNYADEDYISIGRLSNAAFIVAGRITNVAGRYSVSFRINNTETNEIKASFNKAYPLADIETGFAAKETVMELLAGLGVELTEAGKNNLLAIPEIEVRSTAQLAKGMASEKDGNLVDALAFFVQAVETNPGMREADNYIQNFAAVSIGSSIRERANYAQTQIDRWKKIFADLKVYLDNNLHIGVYDFGVIEDEINMRGAGSVTVTVKPGLKIVPNRTALVVYKRVMDQWNAIKNLEENKSWVREASPPYFGNEITDRGAIKYGLLVEIGLYDDYGDKIGRQGFGVSGISFYSSRELITQRKYFENAKPDSISFYSIPLEDITDTLTPKIDKLFFKYNVREVPVRVMSVAEWEQWLEEQGNVR